VTEYLRQRGIVPLFVTDTEVSVLLFDLYARVLGYPLEYIINGLRFDERGEVIGLDMKYPGNNLFSLASGGACYLNDPYATVSETQLNGATFVPFRQEDWNLILPYLSMNETLFGISIRHDILMVDGVLK
jgi:hypothetical protein